MIMQFKHRTREYYEIDRQTIDGRELILMEDAEDGDEATAIIVDAFDSTIVMDEEVFNGFDDYCEEQARIGQTGRGTPKTTDSTYSQPDPAEWNPEGSGVPCLSPLDDHQVGCSCRSCKPEGRRTIDCTPAGLQTEAGQQRVSAAQKAWDDVTHELANLISQELDNSYDDMDLDEMKRLRRKRNAAQEEFLRAVGNVPPAETAKAIIKDMMAHQPECQCPVCRHPDDPRN